MPTASDADCGVSVAPRAAGESKEMSCSAFELSDIDRDFARHDRAKDWLSQGTNDVRREMA